MPIRKIDAHTALIVVDFQEFTRPFAGDAGPIAYKVAANLAAAFRARSRPVVLVNTAGVVSGRGDLSPDGNRFSIPTEGLTLVPELGEQPSDIVVTKLNWGAFASTDLEQRLSSMGVTQVVICGTAASIGVESTARQAHEAGLNITFAVDAIIDSNPVALKNSMERIFPMLGETGQSADIIAML